MRPRPGSRLDRGHLSDRWRSRLRTRSRAGNQGAKNHESKLLVRQARRAGARTSPTRRSSTRGTRSSESPRPPSAAPICTCTTASFRRWREGDILGHEFMGEVVEVGRGGQEPARRATAWWCRSRSPAATASSASSELFSLCENSNPNAWMAEKMWGHSPAGIFGYSHMLGGYAGGQAEYARVPFADVGPIKIPDGLTDEQVLFLSDIFPTGYMAAENCNIQPGDTVAVWGCGPVGQFAIKSALSAGRGARDRASTAFPSGCAWRASRRAPRRINYEEIDVYEALKEMTGGRGPDACIDAVGMEAHVPGDDWRLRPRQAGDDAGDRSAACAAPGDHGVPQRRHRLGPRRLWRVRRQDAVRLRHEPVAHHQDRARRTCSVTCGRCWSASQKGEIDPSFIITHRMPLDEAPGGTTPSTSGTAALR